MKQIRLHDDVHALLLAAQKRWPAGTSLTVIANQRLRESLEPQKEGPARKTVTTTATAVKLEAKAPPALTGDNERQI